MQLRCCRTIMAIGGSLGNWFVVSAAVKLWRVQQCKGKINFQNIEFE